MRCIVNEITGAFAIAPDNGQELYDQIHPLLLAGQTVELDFDGVRVFASAFFNFAVGQLLKDLSPDSLNQQLQITGLNDNGQAILRRVIETRSATMLNHATSRPWTAQSKNMRLVDD